MKYFLTTQEKKYGTYYLYKCNYREGGKVKSKYVYLGSERTALELLSDFNSEKPQNERLLSYSGELILSKVLELLDFREVLNEVSEAEAEWEIGRFIEMVVVERVLNEYSKWRLARIAHGKSFYSLDEKIPAEKFTEDNIYNYMDYIHPGLDLMKEKLVKNLLALNFVEIDELILDGTSLYCFGSDDMEDPAPESGESPKDSPEMLRRTHGYSRDHRPDLPQINLMLGVSDQYLPLFFETFSGNIPDVVMFENVLEKCKNTYQALLKSVQNKYMVFDKGNNSKDNFKDLDALCARWGFHFVTSVRPSMTAVKKALKPLQVEDLPVIYEQQKTTLRGKAVTIELYGEKRKALLYVNEEIREKRRQEYIEKLEEVQEEIREINQKEVDLEEKSELVEGVLRKNRVLTYFKQEEDGEVIRCVPIDSKVTDKMALFGKFALITDDFSLDARSMARIYKKCIVVEHEFHLLKSLLSIRPFNHWKPERIDVHVAMVLWGVMALALLRLMLLNHGMEFSFERLRELIGDGYISIGDYIYPERKSFRIKRTLNIHSELQKVLNVLNLEWDYFDIDVIPTEEKKKNREK
ncbi:MAG: IS1634 family transposase [Promethearchaeia archaeon]